MAARWCSPAVGIGCHPMRSRPCCAVRPATALPYSGLKQAAGASSYRTESANARPPTPTIPVARSQNGSILTTTGPGDKITQHVWRFTAATNAWTSIYSGTYTYITSTKATRSLKGKGGKAHTPALSSLVASSGSALWAGWAGGLLRCAGIASRWRQLARCGRWSWHASSPVACTLLSRHCGLCAALRAALPCSSSDRTGLHVQVAGSACPGLITLKAIGCHCPQHSG